MIRTTFAALAILASTASLSAQCLNQIVVKPGGAINNFGSGIDFGGPSGLTDGRVTFRACRSTPSIPIQWVLLGTCGQGSLRSNSPFSPRGSLMPHFVSSCGYCSGTFYLNSQCATAIVPLSATAEKCGNRNIYTSSLNLTSLKGFVFGYQFYTQQANNPLCTVGSISGPQWFAVN